MPGIVLQICGPLIMMVALYWSTSQPPDLWRAATVILFTIQVGSVSQGLALMVSAASSIQVGSAGPSGLLCS